MSQEQQPPPPTSAPNTPPIQILLLIFTGMDTLDFCGPFETLSTPRRIAPFTAAAASPPFVLSITSSSQFSLTAQGANIERHIPLSTALSALSTYDILIVPGGPRAHILTLAQPSTPEFGLVKAFADLAPGPGQRCDRTLLSVCTGAFFLAATGCLRHRKATTHYLSLGALEQLCREGGAATGPTEVLGADVTFVDGGRLASNGTTRVITSGGISTGIDACLYLIEITLGEEVARGCAQMLVWQWRREGAVIA